MRPIARATFFGLLAAAAYAPGQSASQESGRKEPSDLATDDAESFWSRLEGADLAQPQPAELWPLLERCNRELVRVSLDAAGDDDSQDDEARMRDWRREYRCAQIATELAARGDSRDREALWQAFDDPDANAEVREGIVRGMLQRRLEEVASDTTAVPVGTATRLFDPRLLRVPERLAEFDRFQQQDESARLAGIPAELRDSLRTVASAHGAYRRLGMGLAGDEPLSYNADSSGFFLQVAEYLRGRVSAAEAIRHIGRFEWGSWCGTGAGSFYEPRDRALLLALVDLGRSELATGALLAVAGDEASTLARLGADDHPRPPLWHGLAARLGHDWEPLAIGSLLLGDRVRGMEVAVHGTERGAGLLLRALAEPAPHDEGARLGDDPMSLAALAALVAGTDACDGFATSSIDETRLAGELTGDIQLEALEAIAARATDEAGLELASEAARQLHRLCRRESLPVFEAMTRSRFAVVRTHAAKARHALTGAELSVAAAPPVGFRVRVDGAPWAGAVEWMTSRVRQTTSETRKLDADGRLELDRDMFLDAKAPVRSIRVAVARLEGSADTWFVARVDPPRRLSAVTEIAVETQRISLVLPGTHAGPCSDDSGCTVRLEAETPHAFAEAVGTDTEARYFQAISEDRPLRADQAWSVRVVRGIRYRAVVWSGNASWTSPVVEPGAKPVSLTLRADRLLSLDERVEAVVEGSL